jgi:GDP-4-dehydro-6-deoxy-D-mannose reductase
VKKKKLLVVGGTGFVGSFVNSVFKSEYDVHLSGPEADVRDAERLRELVAFHTPDEIIHLAAITTVGESFQNPDETYQINFFGTLHLLTALRQCQFSGRLLYVGSSEVYGSPSEAKLPVAEECPLRPRNPYAVSKIAAEALCYQWSQTENFEIIMTRPFNHIGPGQSDRFAIADFARQLVEMRLGRREPILRVGDIDVTRDFTDVRDVVRAYFRLLGNGKNGEVYNVCSGAEYVIRYLLERLCDLARIDVKIEKDMSRFRPTEFRRMCGSYAKLEADTGWHPKIDIETSLLDILNDWESRLK